VSKNYTIDTIEQGQEFQLKKAVRLEDIEVFSTITRDFHPLHSDSDYAIEQGFDNVIAHGALLSAYTSVIVGMHLPGKHAIVLSQTFDYMKPAYPGDVLTILGRVSEIDKRFNTIKVKMVIHNDAGDKLAKGSWTVRIRPEQD
jgi:acyl dehydratase